MTVTVRTGDILFPDGSTQSTAVVAGSEDVQTFNASGTWTKPASGTKARIQLWGGGGGAGRGTNTGVSAIGGGGGAYSEFTVPLTSLGATESVIVGAGGAAGTSGGAIGGSAGGASSFGALYSVAGGSAGGYDSSPNGAGGDVLPGYGGGRADNVRQATFWGGGAGGTTNYKNGGAATWGGGGGGAGVPGSAGGYPGSPSLFGGAGGSSSVGTVPGGGGGALGYLEFGYAGASGRVIVTVT